MPESRFAQQFKRIVTPNLLRQFGETVIYYDRAGNSGRSIQAMVDRSFAPEFSLRVRNSDFDGISSSELDTGGDEISFELRIGETAVRRSITKLEDDSNGITRIVCE